MLFMIITKYKNYYINNICNPKYLNLLNNQKILMLYFSRKFKFILQIFFKK